LNGGFILRRDSRIRKLREDNKMSGTKVAQELGISPQYYYDIEKGERNLNAEIAGKLADIFHTTTDYLLGKTDINLYDFVLTSQEKADLIKENSPSYTTEKEFVEKIELSDEELLSQFKLTLDGRELSEAEAKKLIAYLRVDRQLDSK
jgi:transcriptional regulator with XRE-family HTH domain